MAVTVTFGSLDLLSGTAAAGGYHIVGELPTQGDDLAWDVVRSYLDTLRQVDVHKVPWAMPLTIKIYGTSASDLESKRAALSAQCIAGGTLTFSWGAGSQSWTIWPGQKPSVPINTLYLARHIALATCTLTVCP